ncbi:PREDICTED: uncharacterized protein LOC105967846 [Erythranthe guttata]|uniref:uncharacterized protein LOC105967846 n=1 Tax=Erythranthe guttata TaxID=4155 RepID=UPI00064D7E0F|nr:PREDICTED: uncharacterized protein LOC105967846 [Erythranthe guttata]|eukprot:XP_012847900.1 PREDICTED: uncharacterized protein LOC105967846 [Erythranthe guttata]
MGLDDVMYGTVRSNILSMEPLPNINRAYAMIIQEERHRNIARSNEDRSDAVGFSAQLGSHARAAAVRNKEKPGICTHCGKSGHDAKTCYQIVGYPEWWGDRPRGNEKGTPRGRGGGLIGRSRGGGARVNVTRVPTENEATRFDTERQDFPNLSGEQWATLLEMLNSSKSGGERLSGKKIYDEWIVDSGASHHITGNLELLSHVCEITPTPVEIPDGENAIALKEGKLCLGSGRYLNNVLFVPTMTCTLISVSKFLKALKCIITFTDKLCVIQDRISRFLIGAGEECDGVYFFRAIPTARACKANGLDERELWHRRLGHPSKKLLSFIPVVKSGSSDHTNKDSCDICLRAKQTREVFPTSNNKALIVLL